MRNGARFYLTSVFWASALVGVAAAYQVITALVHDTPWVLTRLVLQLPSWLGLFLLFAAFAGGLSVYRTTFPRWVVVQAIPVAVLSYALLAHLAPRAKYEVESVGGADVSSRFPFGPYTPSALNALKRWVEAYPPREFGYSVDRPLEWPPNLLGFRIHSYIALSIFALLAALLGHQTGGLTTGLPPPARRNARWAIGLFGSVAFLFAVKVGEDWVRADPTHPATVGAWAPLLVPLVELAVLGLLVRRRRHLHAFGSPSI